MKTSDATAASASSSASSPGPAWDLRLYVAGQTPKSLRAIANLEHLCKRRLAGDYRIEVIDLLLQPELAAIDQILAIPTLVRKSPLPERKVVGDLSATDRVLTGLDMSPEAGVAKASPPDTRSP